MKKAVVAGAAVLLSLITGDLAEAADLRAPPAYKAPVVAPGYSWSGCYLGGHIGGGWARKQITGGVNPFFNPFFSPTGVDLDGFLGGGQAGCDYQFATNWVIGVEGTVSWSNLRGDAPDVLSGVDAVTYHVKTDWIATATGRMGYAWDRWLVYAKGGAAWAHDKYNATGQDTGTLFDFGATETRVGWTVGAGAEWAFWNNWSTKVEYNYLDFGGRSLQFVNTASLAFAIPAPANVDQKIHTIKLGLNYRFGGNP